MKIRSIKFNTADLPAPKGDRSFIPDKTEGAKPVRCIVEHEGKRWELDPRHLRILQAVYQLAARLRKAPTRQQIGAILGVRFDAGTFKVDLGRLRSAGLVDYPTPGEVIATEKGSALVPKESASRLNLWTGIQKVLDPRHVRILEVVKASRGPVTREQIGKALGINHTAGTFKVDLGKLRTLGLVEYPSSGLVEVTSWVRGLA